MKEKPQKQSLKFHKAKRFAETRKAYRDLALGSEEVSLLSSVSVQARTEEATAILHK